MHTRSVTGIVSAAVALAILLAGCGATAVQHQAHVAAATAQSAASGVTTVAGAPSQSARMVCSPEIVRDISQLMHLAQPPTVSSTWSDHLFTCTYRVPAGRFVLSVQDGPDLAAAQASFTALRGRLSSTTALTGVAAFGLPAYTSPGGVVAFLKDGKTLVVDARGITVASVRDGQTRSDLAYAVAADVMGCWTGA